MNVKYPDVQVELTGHEGNVFGIIGRVSRAIRKAHGPEAGKEFTQAATSCGSYDEVLNLCMQTVEVS